MIVSHNVSHEMCHVIPLIYLEFAKQAIPLFIPNRMLLWSSKQEMVQASSKSHILSYDLNKKSIINLNQRKPKSKIDPKEN